MDSSDVSLRPALFLVEPRFRELVFGGEIMKRLEETLDFVAPPQCRETHAALDAALRAKVEVIVSSWGMPQMDEDFLRRYPALKMVFFSGGSVRSFVTPESWARGVRVVTAVAANAVPVAEFVFAQIVLGLKQVWPQMLAVKANRGYVHGAHQPPGAYRSTVGLIGLGHVGRRVAQRLTTLEVTTVAFDPYTAEAEAAELGVRLCSLDELFAVSNVVSCHLPQLPETDRLLRGRYFRSMPLGAAFVNTARGSVVHEGELIEVLEKRPDLLAVLDVTAPEPPAPDSALYRLPNVLLTPHLAGSLGGECRRLGDSIVEDAKRFARGTCIRNEVTRASMEHAA